MKEKKSACRCSEKKRARDCGEADGGRRGEKKKRKAGLGNY